MSNKEGRGGGGEIAKDGGSGRKGEGEREKKDDKLSKGD